MNELTGYTLAAADGEIGRCTDLLFDDEQWSIRYLVADTGKWIPDRKVVIAPQFLADPDWPAKRVEVRLTREQIERSPELSQHEPVSARREAELAAYYGVGPVWPAPAPTGLGRPLRTKEAPDPDEGDPRLRSLDEIEGYRVRASDDGVGHVEDLIADDQEWSIEYLVVDTRNWLPGRKVLVSPKRLREFDWSKGVAKVDLTKTQIESSPEYDPARPVYRAYHAQQHPPMNGGHDA